jgi:hypothetical protein
VPGLGLATCTSVVPGPERISVRFVKLLSSNQYPTAAQDVTEAQSMELRTLLTGPWFGVPAIAHTLPLEASARV